MLTLQYDTHNVINMYYTYIIFKLQKNEGNIMV